MKITVYTAGRGCGQCQMTERTLTERGIEYTAIQLAEHPDIAQSLKDTYGYTQAPVVITDDNRHWSGFRPDKIAGLNN